MKREALFTSKFKRWLMKNGVSGAYEIKHTRGKDSFRLNELREHQLDALLAAESLHGFAYKIPDDGIAYKPFDLFFMKRANAYVVICFPEEFVLIGPSVLRSLKFKKKTSLSLKEAKAYARMIVQLKDM